MKTIALALEIDEVNFVLQSLGALPTHSGAYPLLQKIKQQAEAALQESQIE